MGKFLKKFKQGARNIDKEINKKLNQEKKIGKGERVGNFVGNDLDDFGLDDFEDNKNYNDNFGDEVGVQQSQKPESFHHFILENQYRDLEMSIRGYKDIFMKDTRKWVTKRKTEHCFTDEESEEILRTAQSHLATDIKLSFINKETFPLLIDAIYKQIELLFESIAEYRYGRYNDFKKENGKLIFIAVNEERQYKMKLMNQKIFLELMTRIQANYSRAIQGMENRQTHESVKGQESLQAKEYDDRKFRSYT